MASIPDDPKDQFLFFIDNPIVAGESGGKALIAGFLALVAPIVGVGGDSGSSAMAALFDAELFASAPAQSAPADESGGKGGGHHGADAGAALGLALGLLGGLARGDLDI